MKVQLTNGPEYPAFRGAKNPRGPSPARERKRVGWSGDFHTPSQAKTTASSATLTMDGGEALGPPPPLTPFQAKTTGKGGAASKEAGCALSLHPLGGAGLGLAETSAGAAPPFLPGSSRCAGGGRRSEGEEDSGSIGSLSLVHGPEGQQGRGDGCGVCESFSLRGNGASYKGESNKYSRND